MELKLISEQQVEDVQYAWKVILAMVLAKLGEKKKNQPP